MAETGIVAGICTSPSSSPSSSPYPIEKIGDSPYPYPYPVNAGIFRQNGGEFGQYPRGRVYLPSLATSHNSWFHLYKPQRVDTCSRLSCYEPSSITLGGVPNTNHNLYSQHKIRNLIGHNM